MGIAQGIANLTQRDRVSRPVVEEQKSYSFETDLLVDSFDYNIWGPPKSKFWKENWAQSDFPILALSWLR